MNLTALQHSAFLQSLGWAIANSLWQAGVLWILYHFITASYKNASSKFKTNLSTALLFSVFTWFIITFFQKLFLLQNQTPVPVTATAVFNQHIFSQGLFNWQAIIANAVKALPFLSMAYLFLLIVLAFRLINSYRYIYFIKANGLEKPGVEWRLFADKVANHIGITKKIKIWLSEHIDVPATIGFLKPVILIPIASVNQLTVDQLEAVILHELSHIKRNDYLINLFISLIETILFFNPFVVLLSKIIKRERENCCDDFVIQYQYDRHSYASALLSLEQYRIQNLRFVLTATSGKKLLLDRIKRIMEVKSKSSSLNYGQKLLALLLITGIICSIAWLSPEKKQTAQKKMNAEKQLLTKQENAHYKTPGILPPPNDQGNKNVAVSSKPKKPVQADIFNGDFYTADDNAVIVPDENALISFVKEQSKKLINPKEANKKFIYKPAKDKRAFFPASGYSYSYNDNSGYSPNLILSKVQGLRNLPVFFDFEKLKGEVDKANFAFAYNWDNKTQQEIENTFQKMKLRVPTEAEKKQLEKKIEKFVEDETKNVNQRIRQGTQGVTTERPGVQMLHKKLLVADSLRSASVAMLDAYNNEKTLFERNLRTDLVVATAPVPYGVGGGEKWTNVNPSTYEYNVSTNDDERSSKKSTTIIRNEGKLNVECKGGMVYLNGKKMQISESNLIKLQLKPKKVIVTTDKDIMEIQIDD